MHKYIITHLLEIKFVLNLYKKQ